MSIETGIQILTTCGFQNVAELSTAEQVLTLNLQNKSLCYEYPTQILKYTSLLFFHRYSNVWLKEVALNQSVHILPFPINLHSNHEIEIMQLLASNEYQPCLEGKTFKNVSNETADKIQQLSCKSGMFCIIQVMDIVNQSYSVYFPDSELEDTSFLCNGTTQNVDSVAIATKDANSVFMCRKLTETFAYVPFMVKN